ncbi:MAG: hypothetical protein U9R32_04760 [Bacteroidota bacterium]|nr:hypothetical protein [Bacteroidota bacterium]
MESSVETTFEMSENGKIIYNKLVKFKNEMENTQKSETLMSIDSAQWYIEAYYNVTSGYPDSLYSKFEVDSAIYTLHVDENSMIAVSDMATLISDLESHLTTVIGESGFEFGHMVVGDVNLSVASKSSEVKVFVSTGFGFGERPMYTPFPLDECWFYGMTAGRCDLTPPTPPYEDAGDQLEWRFNSPNPINIPYPSCGNGSVKIIETLSHSTSGEDNSLIYYEWYPGPKDYPGYEGAYWNDFLNNGTTLFYGNEQSGGLVPDDHCFFTSVDITTYCSDKKDINGIDGFEYYHRYNTFYSVYECIAGLPD